MLVRLIVAVAVLASAAGCSEPVATRTISVTEAVAADGNLPLERLSLPSGFQISIWGRVPGARSLARGENGTIFVGTRSASGGVYAIRDNDGDGEADELHTLAEDLFMPNGVAIRDGDLFVAEVNRILRFDDIESRLADPGAPVVVTEDLPDMRHHGWKFIDFGPDGMLYVPVGAPCNRCDSANPLFASIAGCTRTEPGSRSPPGACGCRSASTGTRTPGRCGSPTTTPTGSATTTRPAR